MNARVVIKSKKEGQLQEIIVSGPREFVLGRGPSSAAVFDGPGISREHVAIAVNVSEIFVTDLSVNGAWINGKRLEQQQRHRVEQGDVVEIPGYEVLFHVDGAAALSSKTGSLPAAVSGEAPVVTAAGAPASGLLSSFSFLDYLMVVLALVSIMVAVLYMLSS